jgi:hypothetical protein
MARTRKHRNKWQVLYRDPAAKKEQSVGAFTPKSDATKQGRAIAYRLETEDFRDSSIDYVPEHLARIDNGQE